MEVKVEVEGSVDVFIGREGIREEMVVEVEEEIAFFLYISTEEVKGDYTHKFVYWTRRKREGRDGTG